MIDIKELLKAGVHFGHRTSKWSPKMAPFIWGAKNQVHLIDISKTAILLKRASTFLQQTASEGKLILWIGTKKAAQSTIEKTGKELKMPFVINRWVGGTLSNFSEIKKAITRLLHLRDALMKSSGRFTKKEASTIQKEIGRLEKNIGGIINLTSKPGAIVVIDALKEKAAIKEALTLGIPVVAMLDTNTDPSGINFIIPANDDAIKSIDVIVNNLSAAVKAGCLEFEAKGKAEIAEHEAAKKSLKTSEVITIDENLEKELIQAGMSDNSENKTSGKSSKPTTQKSAPIRRPVTLRKKTS